jgi:hypothetical protein
MLYHTTPDWRQIEKQVKVVSRVRELMLLVYVQYRDGANKSPIKALATNAEFVALLPELNCPATWEQFTRDERRIITKAYKMESQ